MPGRACGHYAGGRCLYGERLNPGYHVSWRCRVLKQWEKEYDDFVHRAEAFGLEDAAAKPMLEKHFQKVLKQAIACPRFEPEASAGMPPCLHLLDELCLKELPVCHGVCRFFKPADKPSEEP